MAAGGIRATRVTAGGLGGAGRTARDSAGGIGGSRGPVAPGQCAASARRLAQQGPLTREHGQFEEGAGESD